MGATRIMQFFDLRFGSGAERLAANWEQKQRHENQETRNLLE
jgi:hypothetical protein